jgi:hypothetical protein
MSDASNIISLQNATRATQPDPFLIDRARLTDLLVRHCLIDSFHRFIANGKPYPFANGSQLLPSQGQAWEEHRDQNTALLFLIDGTMPLPLNRHFRLRASNRVSWRNIQRLAPDLDLSDFKAKHCRLDETLDDGGFALAASSCIFGLCPFSPKRRGVRRGRPQSHACESGAPDRHGD